MEIEEFEKRESEIDYQIECLKLAKEKLYNQYIEENCEFKVGDKISIRGFKGVIESITLSFGSFRYRWRKYNKDGMLGRRVHYIYRSEIELIEKL